MKNLFVWQIYYLVIRFRIDGCTFGFVANVLSWQHDGADSAHISLLKLVCPVGTINFRNNKRASKRANIRSEVSNNRYLCFYDSSLVAYLSIFSQLGCIDLNTAWAHIIFTIWQFTHPNSCPPLGKHSALILILFASGIQRV